MIKQANAIIGRLDNDPRKYAVVSNPSYVYPQEEYYPLAPALEQADVVVNLVGENLAGGQWTERMKSRIMQSRKEAGTALSEAFASARHKPCVLVQASATGYYVFS